MGCWDVFCPICGIPVWIPKNDLDKKYTSKMKWIKNAYFMTATNQIVKKCVEIACSNVFYCAKNKGINYIAEIFDNKVYDDYEKNGYFIHKDCYEFIKQYFKINIVFGDFYHPKKLSWTLNGHYVNFGGVEKYWNQDTNWNKMIEDGNFWMAETPLKNAKNSKRIIKIIKQLKIKPDRSGPTISASFFANGTIKIGNDGYFWIIKNKKWTKLPEKPVIEKVKNNKNIMKKIPKIGFTNTKPIFIKDYDNDEISIIKSTL